MIKDHGTQFSSSHLNSILIGEGSRRNLDRGVAWGVVKGGVVGAVGGADGAKLRPGGGQADTSTE